MKDAGVPTERRLSEKCPISGFHQNVRDRDTMIAKPTQTRAGDHW